LLESFLAASKPVALVCHAPGALRHVRTPAGRPLVEGKRVTGFTNSKEEGEGLTDVVPFLVEDDLKAKGGKFERTEDWGVFIVTDGLPPVKTPRRLLRPPRGARKGAAENMLIRKVSSVGGLESTPDRSRGAAYSPANV
jgi:putative intracellular protease/amidase